MRTRRQTYPAATPPIPEFLTARPIVQALPASATRSGNGGSEKKNCIRGLWDKKIPTDLLQEILSPAPTSASCCVISFAHQQNLDVFVVLDTWRPGDSVWTTRRFPNRSYGYGTVKCHFSNGMFYCLSTSGYIGVFEPSGATWNIIPVNPCPVFSRRHHDKLVRPVFMTEHEGDIYVMTTRRKNNSKQLVFKLNLERNVWEEMRVLGGLTVFACNAASLTRAGLSAEERNRIYTLHIGDYGRLGIYYLGCVKCSLPAYTTYLSNRSAWLQPPHNNFFSL
ncbi:hypothetical protein ARALYDRAFT_898245 [Arabidopsis lyrata subsp. lyrata]|uniref:KIB1-4 beta-propeller domain-containing protein n=1 Tax=Arabidopsis lyrata subsp. lyrata TaxID=81972 RepID=D7L943_ARALL|nr:hypothetical protein ARALYDRAFT_898245 [Arabidopsis lyrata subsp. lyrata]